MQLTALALTPWSCPWSSSAYREGNPRPAPDDPGILGSSKGITMRYYNADQCGMLTVYINALSMPIFRFQLARAYLRRMLAGQCLASCPPRTSEYGWWMSCPSSFPRGTGARKKGRTQINSMSSTSIKLHPNKHCTIYRHIISNQELYYTWLTNII